MTENEELQARCIELETRNEDLARTIQEQNKMIRGKTGEFCLSPSWIVYGAVIAANYLWGDGMTGAENDLMHCECGKRLEQFGGGTCSDCFMKSVHESIANRNKNKEIKIWHWDKILHAFDKKMLRTS